MITPIIRLLFEVLAEVPPSQWESTANKLRSKLNELPTEYAELNPETLHHEFVRAIRTDSVLHGYSLSTDQQRAALIFTLNHRGMLARFQSCEPSSSEVQRFLVAYAKHKILIAQELNPTCVSTSTITISSTSVDSTNGVVPRLS